MSDKKIDFIKQIELQNKTRTFLENHNSFGENEKNLHYEVGKKIDPNEIHFALFYGPLSYEMYKGAMEIFPKNRVFYFENKADVCDKLKQLVTKSSLIFVKGSHGVHMEEIIECVRTLKI